MNTYFSTFVLSIVINLSAPGIQQINDNPSHDIFSGKDFSSGNLSPENQKLDSRAYHSYRDKLQNAQFIFEQNKRGTVAFLGGSITANGGWRDSICDFLQHRFPETRFEFIPAGIPSMGSSPGAFRLQRDVLGKGKVDLLFVEAAVNDRVNGFNSEEQLLGMEGIVRHAREANPAMDIVMMHFVDPDKMDEYRKGKIPAEIVNHEKVAEWYNISTINLAKEVTERIDNREFDWENDFKNLHPSPFGQQIYFQSMKVFLENCWNSQDPAENKVTDHLLPGKLSEACYNQGVLIPSIIAGSSKGWKIDPSWAPADNSGTRADFTHVPMLVSEGGKGVLSFEFEGNAIGIAVASGPDAGVIEYRIDKGKWQKRDLFTQWSKGLHLPFFYTLGYGLKPGKHKLDMRISEEKNALSKGNACRIRYFYVNLGG